jgi:hypothetical protein
VNSVDVDDLVPLAIPLKIEVSEGAEAGGA